MDERVNAFVMYTFVMYTSVRVYVTKSAVRYSRTVAPGALVLVAMFCRFVRKHFKLVLRRQLRSIMPTFFIGLIPREKSLLCQTVILEIVGMHNLQLRVVITIF